VTEDAYASESLDALQDCYLHFCRLIGREGRVTWAEERDVAWVMTPIPLPGFNRIIRIRMDADHADARIREISERFRTAGVRPTWWLDGRSTPMDLGDRLMRMGHLSETVPAMRGEASDVPELALPSGVTLAWADDPGPLGEAMNVIAAGFGMPAELGDALADLMAPIARPDHPARTVVARLDGTPVAAAQGILTGAAVAIFNVATLEAARGRGIGAAVTVAVLRDAIERGARFGVLESSAMGHSVYRRIGFRDIASLQVYGWPGS